VRTRRSLFRRYFSSLAQDAGWDDAIIGHVGRFGQYRLSFHPGTAAIMSATPRMCCAKTSGQISVPNLCTCDAQCPVLALNVSAGMVRIRQL
jgi:hypothetical protein